MAYPKNIVECIIKLFPDAIVDKDFVCQQRASSGLEISKWNLRGFQTDTKPTEAELNSVADEVQGEFDAQQYARNRALEYPPIAEQIDILYHSGVAGLQAELKKTKDKFPKG